MCTRYPIINRVSELKVHIELTRFVQPEKKSKLMQTKGQLMKSLHTAFSFAPPSILSLTIWAGFVGVAFSSWLARKASGIPILECGYHFRFLARLYKFLITSVFLNRSFRSSTDASFGFPGAHASGVSRFCEELKVFFFEGFQFWMGFQHHQRVCVLHLQPLFCILPETYHLRLQLPLLGRFLYIFLRCIPALYSITIGSIIAHATPCGVS